MRAEAGLCNQLKAVRSRMGMSQQALAAAAGVARQTIGGIEAGLYAPSAAVALRLARALGCPVEELFWLEETLPEVEARLAGPPAGSAGRPTSGPEVPARVALAQVGGRWVAHPLSGDRAFRAETIPADGAVSGAETAGTVRVRLLDDPAALGRSVFLAGCTPALSLWVRAAERWHPGLRVHWSFANSTEALRSLGRGEVHAAGVHLGGTDGEANAAFARRELPGRNVVLVNLGTWEEGLLVHPDRRGEIRGVDDLARPDVTLVNREAGSGARALLDAALARAGVPTRALRGFDRVVPGHLEVAREVACGRADAGISAASVAAAYGLAFVPLREVRYDLAVLREHLEFEPLRQILATLHHRWVRAQLRLLGGYDTRATGEIVAEIDGRERSAE